MKQKTALTDKVSFNLLKEYYDAMHQFFDEANFEPLDNFKLEHKEEFKFLNAIHQRRTALNKNLEAMQALHKGCYFGTLTFNKGKDANKVKTKRREAFLRLNELFEFVLLVEEYGELRGRYHIHFVGVFRDGKDFEDFRKCWHSRQNLEKVQSTKKTSQYLVKYVCKEIPRLRRNKGLVRLERAYRNGKALEKSGFASLGPQYQINRVLALNAFDEL